MCMVSTDCINNGSLCSLVGVSMGCLSCQWHSWQVSHPWCDLLHRNAWCINASQNKYMPLTWMANHAAHTPECREPLFNAIHYINVTELCHEHRYLVNRPLDRVDTYLHVSSFDWCHSGMISCTGMLDMNGTPWPSHSRMQCMEPFLCNPLRQWDAI